MIASNDTITVAGATLKADLTGGLYWPREATLVVADLHLEKASHFAPAGLLLPPFDTRATLARLVDLCRRLGPRRVIALGDSFHDRKAPARLAQADAATLHGLTATHDWIWVAGNHDGAPPAALGGRAVSELCLWPLVFRHEPEQGRVDGEIAGHLHPCASVRVRGRRLRRRCFVGDDRRLIIPAFGALTGGLDLGHDAFGGLFGGELRAWLIGHKQVHAVAGHRLRGVPDLAPALT